MRRATAADKTNIVQILSESFESNKSVNYLVRQAGRRSRRLRALMEYAFDQCMLFGELWVSDDQQACALLIFPEKKRTTLHSVWLDLQLVVRCIGWRRVGKAIAREATIRKVHPDGPLAYLWFVGVAKIAQHNGIGSRLMQELLASETLRERTVCLETSTETNLPWYTRFGFEVYHQFDWGYRLYCLKRQPV